MTRKLSPHRGALISFCLSNSDEVTLSAFLQYDAAKGNASHLTPATSGILSLLLKNRRSDIFVVDLPHGIVDSLSLQTKPSRSYLRNRNFTVNETCTTVIPYFQTRIVASAPQSLWHWLENSLHVSWNPMCTCGVQWLLPLKGTFQVTVVADSVRKLGLQ